MDFPFGAKVYRLRADPVWNEYSHKWVPGDWDDPSVLPIPGAFIQQSSTSSLSTATRDQALEAKSLFCDGDHDVAKGDRIYQGNFTPPLPDGVAKIPAGTVFAGVIYDINGIPPAADTSPFTGWTPPREIPLTRYVG